MERKALAFKDAEVLKASKVLLDNFVEQCGFGAAPSVAIARPGK